MHFIVISDNASLFTVTVLERIKLHEGVPPLIVFSGTLSARNCYAERSYDL